MDSKHPPVIHNSTDFPQWKEDITLWIEGTDIPQERHGIVAAMHCEDEAKNLVRSLDKSKLKGPDGIKFLCAAMAKEFGLAEEQSLFAKYNNLMTLKRTGTISEYTMKFRECVRSLESSSIKTPDCILSLQFILNAELPVTSEQRTSLYTVLLSSVGEVKKFTLEIVTAKARTLFMDSENATQSTSGTSHEILATKGYGKFGSFRNRSSYEKGKGKYGYSTSGPSSVRNSRPKGKGKEGEKVTDVAESSTNQEITMVKIAMTTDSTLERVRVNISTETMELMRAMTKPPRISTPYSTFSILLILKNLLFLD